MVFWDLYGVSQIFGVKAGYRGFYSSEPVELNRKLVHSWHNEGDTARDVVPLVFLVFFFFLMFFLKLRNKYKNKK